MRSTWVIKLSHYEAMCGHKAELSHFLIRGNERDGDENDIANQDTALGLVCVMHLRGI